MRFGKHGSIDEFHCCYGSPYGIAMANDGKQEHSATLFPTAITPLKSLEIHNHFVVQRQLFIAEARVTDVVPMIIRFDRWVLVGSLFCPPAYLT